ncbi:hypothetical protein BV22DRAFT_1010857 [Leucogyrophana mollusca]|uniref:Uncharacterized protein n=1 Tax=Leucogyrophana mollusca TaxID=85980 RepID=A0ACB8BLX7_9AGAM|nr:hypothetical protein BV22DRAFT_1010857 [Leucogyrophana mollusca]
MSRRRSISTTMGPPPDRDIIMGPPPPPLPSVQQSQPLQQQSSKDNQEIVEKYRKLKRRYFELEDKFKETHAELQRSGERNVKMREERECVWDLRLFVWLILSRIHELESHSEPNVAGVPYAPSSAFPRALLTSRAQTSFVANLRQAMAEDETDDHSIDPLLTSRHIGPLARKRAEDEHRERVEEEARETRRAARRSRGGTGKGKEAGGQTGQGQPLMTFTPAPPHQGGPNAPPVLVTNKGTRVRIKPPVPPPLSSEPGPSAHPANSQSSLSPILSPQDDHYDPVHHSANGSHHRPDNSPPQPGPSPSLAPQMSPTASTSTSRPSDVQRHAKPKRLKAHTVTSKNYSIPTVPRDKKGNPLLPLNVGIMTVVNLGEVCMREHFHTERYIFPVGYEVTRRYLSTVDPTAEVVYHCSILDGGDGPKFQIVASDVPDRPMIAGTATGAWSTIVKQANSIRNRQHSNSVSGPDFFGLGQNTIKHLIQELPGADRLRDYVWQIFVEGG